MMTFALPSLYQPFTRAVNTGASPESRLLQKHVSEIVQHFRRRASRERAFSDLAKVIVSGKEPDWDKYGALPVDQHAAQLACRFLNMLPSAVPTPDVGLDPDGQVSFDWIVAADRQLTASLSPDGVLSYAAIFGTAEKHGKEVFDDTVPQEIIEAIRRLGYKY